MYRIIDTRSAGKTSRLMLLAKENNGVIVCRNPEAYRKKAINYGIVGIEFIDYNTFFASMPFNHAKKVFIDDLEEFLELCGNVNGYTITVGE